MDRHALDEARTVLDEARRVVCLTGAGISAESGVPTFRGEEGLWKSYRSEDLATPEAFARDPRLVWEWYGWRREKIAVCAPNPGHLALARRAMAGGLTLVTQNVDGLHEMAARAVAADDDPTPALAMELHGAVFRDRCTECQALWDGREPVDASSLDTLPRCGICGALRRPDVVWFGEALDEIVLQDAFRRASEAEVCLVVGTSALVYPAASVPLMTLGHGGVVVEVNPQETPLSPDARHVLRGPAAEVLPRLLL